MGEQAIVSADPNQGFKQLSDGEKKDYIYVHEDTKAKQGYAEYMQASINDVQQIFVTGGLQEERD